MSVLIEITPAFARNSKLFNEKPSMAISVGSDLQNTVGTNQDFFVKRL